MRPNLYLNKLLSETLIARPENQLLRRFNHGVLFEGIRMQGLKLAYSYLCLSSRRALFPRLNTLAGAIDSCSPQCLRNRVYHFSSDNVNVALPSQRIAVRESRRMDGTYEDSARSDLW